MWNTIVNFLCALLAATIAWLLLGLWLHSTPVQAQETKLESDKKYQLFVVFEECKIGLTSAPVEVTVGFLRMMHGILTPSDWLYITERESGSEGIKRAEKILEVCGKGKGI